ncbi:MAG: type II toxin-antitoxin system RelB/DinJ family antitoxin [Spirochaetaceae bacterium]|nr:type II toxin-antitoxin system RelB/DinJ family antitoxin [Spirochaetaceae bacterium]
MPETLISFRLDEDIKKKLERLCQEVGLGMTEALAILAAKAVREERLPLEIKTDTAAYYDELSLRQLRLALDDLATGKAKLTPHELIEVEDD